MLYRRRFSYLTPFFQEAEGQQISERKYLERLKNEDFGTTKLGKLRSYCWNLTEYPETSLAARVGCGLELRTGLITIYLWLL